MVGAGLAGSAAAYSLVSRGYSVCVLDAAQGPAQGASALTVGLIAPHISADDAVLSRISRMGVEATLARAQALLGPQDWQLSGVLEHRLKGKALRPQNDTQLAAACLLAQAGLPADAPALWHAKGAWLRPARLVQAQLAHANIQCHWGAKVASLSQTDGVWRATCQDGRVFSAPIVVVCAAFDSVELLQHVEAASGHTPLQKGVKLPLNAFRGQVSWGYEDELPAAVVNLLPPFPVNGLGSLVRCNESATSRRLWMVGSTFVRGLTHTDVRLDEHQANVEKLKELLPALGEALGTVYASFLADEIKKVPMPKLHGWAAVRCTVPDRLPLVGAVSEDAPGLHVLAGLGARGLTLSVLCGELLAAQIDNPKLDSTQSNPLGLVEPSLLKHLMSNRLFHKHNNKA